MPRYFPHLLKILLSTDEHQLREQIQLLKADSEILRSRLPKQIRTTPAERARLVRLGQPLGSRAIQDKKTIVDRTHIVNHRTVTHAACTEY